MLMSPLSASSSSSDALLPSRSAPAMDDGEGAFALLDLLTSREVGLRVHLQIQLPAGTIDARHVGLGIQRLLGESSNMHRARQHYSSDFRPLQRGLHNNINGQNDSYPPLLPLGAPMPLTWKKECCMPAVPGGS